MFAWQSDTSTTVYSFFVPSIEILISKHSYKGSNALPHVKKIMPKKEAPMTIANHGRSDKVNQSKPDSRKRTIPSIKVNKSVNTRSRSREEYDNKCKQQGKNYPEETRCSTKESDGDETDDRKEGVGRRHIYTKHYRERKSNNKESKRNVNGGNSRTPKV